MQFPKGAPAPLVIASTIACASSFVVVTTTGAPLACLRRSLLEAGSRHPSGRHQRRSPPLPISFSVINAPPCLLPSEITINDNNHLAPLSSVLYQRYARSMGPAIRQQNINSWSLMTTYLSARDSAHHIRHQLFDIVYRASWHWVTAIVPPASCSISLRVTGPDSPAMIPSDHSDSLPTHIAGGCECDVARGRGGFGNKRRVGEMMAIFIVPRGGHCR